MNVRHILEAKGRDVVTLKPEATLEETMQVLANRRIGAIVLTNEDGGVAGIVNATWSASSAPRASAPSPRVSAR